LDLFNVGIWLARDLVFRVQGFKSLNLMQLLNPHAQTIQPAPTFAAMTSTIGIPIKLLNEATGHVVTLEVTSGQVYRGKLLEGELNTSRDLDNS
jgi:hypothetical protein